MHHVDYIYYVTLVTMVTEESDPDLGAAQGEEEDMGELTQMEIGECHIINLLITYVSHNIK